MTAEPVTYRTDVGRYYLTPEGGWFPSVTTVIDQTMNPGKAYGLRKWHRADPEHAEAVVEEARARGQLVHDAAEATFSGETYDYTGWEPEVELAAKSLIGAVEMEMTEVWHQEQAVWSEVYGYAGRLDMVGVWRGNPCVVDFKTSKKRVYRSGTADYHAQVAAYALAFNERYPDAPKIEHGVFFNTVHGRGVQPPFSVSVAEWRPEFLKRLGRFRELGRTGQLHQKTNW